MEIILSSITTTNAILVNLKARCLWECDCLHFYWLVLDLLVHVIPKPRKTDVARVVHEWPLCHKAACVALCPLNCYCFTCENKIVFSDRVSRKVLRASRSSIIDSRSSIIDSRFSLPEPLLSIVEDRVSVETVNVLLRGTAVADVSRLFML